jgi:predicted nucleic acid-binding protein
LRFWDSSALVPLVFSELSSEALYGLLREDGSVAVWWGTWTECAATISRLRREGRLDDDGEEETRVALDNLAQDWFEIEPENDMRLLAMLVSKSHPLKAADALQLAAALRWCEGETTGAGFVCLDRRLCRAASDEGFDVLPVPKDAT